MNQLNSKLIQKLLFKNYLVLEQIDKILLICSHNIKTLQEAINYCSKNNIESYRFSSDLFPHFTYISTVLSEKDMTWLFEKLSGVNTKKY